MGQPLTPSIVIEDGFAILENPDASPEDKGAVYAVLHQIQLRINRKLRTVKDDLIVHMERNRLKEMGPLSVKATAIDVAWPVNAEENWGDLTVQSELADYAKIAPEYVRHVPDHLEIRTAELGAGVHAGDPVARQLHATLKERGYRTEEGRRLSLQVKEAGRG